MRLNFFLIISCIFSLAHAFPATYSQETKVKRTFWANKEQKTKEFERAKMQ